MEAVLRAVKMSRYAYRIELLGFVIARVDMATKYFGMNMQQFDNF